MSANETTPKTYDAGPEAVGRVYGVSGRTIRRLADGGGVPHRRVGDQYRFNLAEVDEYFARTGRPAEDPTDPEKLSA